MSRAASHTRTSAKEIGDHLGLDFRMIKACSHRFEELKADGAWEQLYDDRTRPRSDKLDQAWHDFALQYWTDPNLGLVRASEVARDTMRNPNDRSDKHQYRKHYLQKTVGDGHTEMLAAGKSTYGSLFRLSLTRFSDLRPFYVKDATRDTCVCVYHMRWHEFADGLRNYRKTLRTHKISACKCTWAPNERALRKQLVCPRDDG